MIPIVKDPKVKLLTHFGKPLSKSLAMTLVKHYIEWLKTTYQVDVLWLGFFKDRYNKRYAKLYRPMNKTLGPGEIIRLYYVWVEVVYKSKTYTYILVSQKGGAKVSITVETYTYILDLTPIWTDLLKERNYLYGQWEDKESLFKLPFDLP